MRNTLKVGILLVALTALLVWIGSLVGGATGAILGFSLAVLMNFGTFWFSDKLVLAMTGARPVSPAEAPGLHEMVGRLAQRAGIPKPRVFVVDDPSPNAFATGRSPAHGVVAVNTGLLANLSEEEVEGVVAHELAHIRHRDTLTMAVVATIAGAIMIISRFALFFGGDEDGHNPLLMLALVILGPLAAIMIQLGVSRAREYEADRLGAQIAGTPRGLASALGKLDALSQQIPSHTPPAAAHLCIVNPLRGGGIAGLFSTHPPVQERIRRLLARTA
jgi:heat shock protein HtpX